MKTNVKKLNDLLASLLHKKDRNKVEEALYALWYEFHGYERLAIDAIEEYYDTRPAPAEDGEQAGG